MAPKKNTAPKTKNVAPKTSEDMPKLTARRQHTNDGTNEEKNGDLLDLNNKVILENNSESIIIKTDNPEVHEDLDEKNKIVEPNKGKPKSKRKRAVSTDDQTSKVEVSKSRKRAAKLDLISSDITTILTPKKTSKDGTFQNKKTKLIEKKTKKVVKREEQLVEPEPNDLETKKEKQDQNYLQKKNEKSPIPIRSRTVSKIQQAGKKLIKICIPISKLKESPEVFKEKNILTPTLNKERIDKQTNKSPVKSGKFSKIKDSDDSVNLVVPGSRKKYVRKAKNIYIDYKEPNLSRRPQYKVKNDDKEELEKIPEDYDDNEIILSDDLPNDNNTPESQKNEIKPTVKKRKAKTIKK